MSDSTTSARNASSWSVQRGGRQGGAQGSTPPQSVTVGSSTSCLGAAPLGSTGVELGLSALNPHFNSHGFDPAARLARLQTVNLVSGGGQSLKVEPPADCLELSGGRIRLAGNASDSF